MNLLKCCLLPLLTCCFLLSCRNENSITGLWRPLQAKVWDNYHKSFSTIDLETRQFYYDSTDYQMTEFLTPGLKDSLLHLLGESYLVLNSNGIFQMNDYAFFVPDVTDKAWDQVRGGKWNMNEVDSVLQLKHPNGAVKCFKILSFKENKMVISELYECQGPSMIEVTLHR